MKDRISSVAMFVLILAWALLAVHFGGVAQAKTIIDLQPFRTTSSISVRDAEGNEGLATLINLNPAINSRYLLRLDWGDGAAEETHDLQNANPGGQTLRLEGTNQYGIVVASGKQDTACDLWGPRGRESLKDATRSAIPYAPLCGGGIYLRNPTKGHQTPIEQVTDLLRDKVPGGEAVVAFVRDTLFARLYQMKAEENIESRPVDGPPPRTSDQGPAPALVDPTFVGRAVLPADLAIELEDMPSGGLVPGAWYAAKDNQGIYLSVITPERIAPEILRSYPRRVNNLGSVESKQLVYLVAFDLLRFDLRYSLGTTHPDVGWSGHIQSRMKEKSLPGPDGIDTIRPLVRTGLIDPIAAPRTVAAFTAGFKRYHGAFKDGPLALKNHGSHYGFLEDGVMFSALQPELSTLYVLNDGRADMKTWTPEDNTNLLPRVRYALQNGVPLITEFDEAGQISVPGTFVNRWGEGNWAGTADQKLQTMRAGAALQESRGGRFLVYAFFWSTTPSAMARVFQAYQCRYSMPLDMNALEHTYLAVYARQGSNLSVQHLIKGMEVVDMTLKGRHVPRFLGYPDDRDFFYLTRKEAP